MTLPSPKQSKPHLEATVARVSIGPGGVKRRRGWHTEDFVAHIMLPDEVAEQLLVDALLVYDLCHLSACISTHL